MSRSTRFLRACRREPVDCTPVWLMRQAGRYQPSYRALRERHSFLELCKNPDLASRVTVTAAEELGVDAAIIFSDILIPVEAMGAPLAITDEGPVLSAPVRDEAAVEALRVPEPARDLPFLLEAIRLTRERLAGEVPLIGFAGAPLTLASYLVEGGNSKTHSSLKELLFARPELARRLLDKLARAVSSVLLAQIEAGCDAVQLFDSWAGILSPRDYRTLALPPTRSILEAIAPTGVPRILFATGASTLLGAMGESGADVIGIDWRDDLGEARRRLGPGLAVQGNLEPACLFLDEVGLEARVRETLGSAGPEPGHIFNLGHGVLPRTDPARARFLVELVHRLTARGAAGEAGR
jgi:uroporphyrinogen decarboxylase